MPMGTLRIRELSRRDGAQLVDLFRSSFPGEMEISGFDVRAVRKTLRLYGVLKVIQRLTRKPFVLFAVGEVEGEVVAAVSLNREKDAWVHRHGDGGPGTPPKGLRQGDLGARPGGRPNVRGKAGDPPCPRG